jgi:hypothetical protein
MSDPIAALAARLERMEALEEIQTMVARYAIAADRRNDPAMFAPLFAEDAVWEADGFSRYEGRDAIVRGLAEVGEKQILWSVHFMVSPLVELDADLQGARCRWYIWELATMADGVNSNDHWLAGWYDSRVRREAGGWKFTKVHLDFRLVSPVSPPWQGKKAFVR